MGKMDEDAANGAHWNLKATGPTMKKTLAVSAMLIAGGGVLGLVWILVWPSSRAEPSSQPKAFTDPHQETVDAMRAFIKTQDAAWNTQRWQWRKAQASQQANAPRQRGSRSKEFNPRIQMKDPLDPNTYFTILRHLSMEPGCVLDFIYCAQGLDGRPMLYARKADAAPLETLEEYEKQLGEDVPYDEVCDEYLKHVRTDGTADGFFQLAVLQIMGNQFYLGWHANYNDRRIICDVATLEYVVASEQKDYHLEIPKNMWSQGRNLDLRPQVQLKDSHATVSVVVFSKWSGFSRLTISFQREFPHTINLENSQVLVPYECGINF